jgi:hypothetical protein
VWGCASAGVLIADFVEPTFHAWNLPAAIVTKLISLLSSIRRIVIFKPVLGKCPLSGKPGNMSHKLGWVAAS